MNYETAGVHSMTGFASEARQLADGRMVVLAVKSVNHRHLDLQVRVPGGLDALEPALRRAVKAAVRRGHVELTLTVTKPGGAGTAEMDEAVLDRYVQTFRKAAGRLGLPYAPDLHELVRLPGVLGQPVNASAAAGELEAPALAALEALLPVVNAARAVEGLALAQELRAGVARLQVSTAEVRRLREGAPARELARLRARLAELLAGAEGAGGLDSARLAAEVAMLVARGDVEEELVRLETHLGRFLELLDAGGEVGRALDFLLQELNRETNTLLSKTGGSEAGLRLTDLGLEMKVELERAREQVQNLE